MRWKTWTAPWRLSTGFPYVSIGPGGYPKGLVYFRKNLSRIWMNWVWPYFSTFIYNIAKSYESGESTSLKLQVVDHWMNWVQSYFRKPPYIYIYTHIPAFDWSWPDWLVSTITITHWYPSFRSRGMVTNQRSRRIGVDASTAEWQFPHDAGGAGAGESRGFPSSWGYPHSWMVYSGYSGTIHENPI